ncbi:MAG: hypothetical protein NZM15_00500 [Flavobacteriales bacterium]|nr:hypothetical protein [Flavobacteriales bacterium]MDW8431165.1 hypothetical protein [Flavobacteriales bacterium]
MHETLPRIQDSFPWGEDLWLKASAGPFLPESWENELRQGPWYRLFLPRALGGAQCSLPQGLEVLIQAAAHQGSLGWRVNLGAGAGFFAGCMAPETARQVYSAPGSVVAGSGAAKGRARWDGKNWRLSGTWQHCTGALQATAFTFNAITDEGQIRTFILQPDQVQILKHWPYFGLKSSHTYTVQTPEEAVVEPHMIFDIGKAHQFWDYPLYRMDFMVFAKYCMAASLVGMALCVCHHAHAWTAAGSKANPHFYQALRLLETAATHAREILNADSEKLYKRLLHNSADSDHTFPSATIFKKISEILQYSWQLFQSGGMDMCREDVPVHQALRDMWLAGQHFLVK